MTEPRVLHVLNEAEGVIVGDLSGAANPVVVLSDDVMSNLLVILREVQEKGTIANAESSLAFRKLVSGVETFVENYRVTRNKFTAASASALKCLVSNASSRKQPKSWKSSWGGNDRSYVDAQQRAAADVRRRTPLSADVGRHETDQHAFHSALY